MLRVWITAAPQTERSTYSWPAAAPGRASVRTSRAICRVPRDRDRSSARTQPCLCATRGRAGQDCAMSGWRRRIFSHWSPQQLGFFDVIEIHLGVLHHLRRSLRRVGGGSCPPAQAGRPDDGRTLQRNRNDASGVRAPRAPLSPNTAMSRRPRVSGAFGRPRCALPATDPGQEPVCQAPDFFDDQRVPRLPVPRPGTPVHPARNRRASWPEPWPHVCRLRAHVRAPDLCCAASPTIRERSTWATGNGSKRKS